MTKQTVFILGALAAISIGSNIRAGALVMCDSSGVAVCSVPPGSNCTPFQPVHPCEDREQCESDLSSSAAGGVHCGSGYCLDYDGNGCHLCFQSVSLAGAPPPCQWPACKGVDPKPAYCNDCGQGRSASEGIKALGGSLENEMSTGGVCCSWAEVQGCFKGC